MSNQKQPGIPFVFKGEKLIIPSLSLGDFIDNHTTLSRTVTSQEELIHWYPELLAIVGLAIRQNYPDISDEILRSSLTVTQFGLLLKIVQGASGMEEVQPGE